MRDIEKVHFSVLVQTGRIVLLMRCTSISRLEDLRRVRQCKNFTLACASVAKEIAGCNMDIDNFLLEYSVCLFVHDCDFLC